MAIADKLTYLNATKLLLRDAINLVLAGRGEAGIVDDDAFRSYADRLFSPQYLFAGGVAGAWYDPSDISTLFQDASGTTPVTADGDPVGLMLDKSGNNRHASQSTPGSRPIYREDGGLRWLEFDGIDDSLSSTVGALMTAPNSMAAAFQYLGTLPASSSGVMVVDGRAADRRNTIVIRGTATALFAGGEMTVAPASNEKIVISAVFKGSPSTVVVNGASVSIPSTGNAGGAADLLPVKIGCDWNSARHANVRVFGLVITDDEVPLNTRKMLGRYLQSKSGTLDQPAAITAQAAATIRLSDDKILYEKNANSLLPAYSTVKLMTALLVHELVPDLSQAVTVVAGDIASVQAGFVQSGDTLTYEDLVYAALLPSDNNAAIALARCVGKILQPSATDSAAKAAFVNAMNAKAAIVGMDGTYQDAWGLGQLTAIDQVKLAKYIYENHPLLAAKAGQLTRTITITGANARQYSVDHTIKANAGGIPGFIGGKTGSGNYTGNITVLWTSTIYGVCATSVLISDPQSMRYADLSSVIADSQ